MQVNAPKCYECANRNEVMVTKGKPRCKKFPKGISKEIFFEGKKCSEYSSKRGVV